VYFSTLRREAADEAAVALQAAARRLQAVIGRETRMKFVPKLGFRIDTGITTGERIDQIIRDLAAEREWADDHDESVQRHD
jgi:ribosome-binding factor A